MPVMSNIDRDFDEASAAYVQAFLLELVTALGSSYILIGIPFYKQ
jgi:hypothetical protein